MPLKYVDVCNLDPPNNNALRVIIDELDIGVQVTVKRVSQDEIELTLPEKEPFTVKLGWRPIL